ncbi:MAG: hypothetical protein U9R01_02210 [candidate division WOR-3 bacterium]|nr:hypothetical protein [candidate division WOR-3 bacterium]
MVINRWLHIQKLQKILRLIPRQIKLMQDGLDKVGLVIGLGDYIEK